MKSQALYSRFAYIYVYNQADIRALLYEMGEGLVESKKCYFVPFPKGAVKCE